MENTNQMEKQLKQIKVILVVATLGIIGIFIQNLNISDDVGVQKVRVMNRVDANVTNTVSTEIENTVSAKIENTVSVTGIVGMQSVGTMDVNIEKVGGWKCWSEIPVEIKR
jgi:hypothetical protein